MALSDDVAARIASVEQAKRAQQEANDPGVTQVKMFFATVVPQAFDEFEAAMVANGRTVKKTLSQIGATFVAQHGGIEELNYSIDRSHGHYVRPSRITVKTVVSPGVTSYTDQGSFGPTDADNHVEAVTVAKIVQSMLDRFQPK